MNSKFEIKEDSTCNRCSCCPYGYHIDIDFVQYCNTLLSTLYESKKCLIPSRFNLKNSNNLNTSSKDNQKLFSPSYDLPDTSLSLICDSKILKKMETISPFNNISYHNDLMKPFKPMVNQLSSSSNQINDSSLNDALTQFEEVFQNQEKSSFLIKSKLNEPISFNSFFNNNFESQTFSPASSINSSSHSNFKKILLSQVRDQLVLSLDRMKSLENQVKDIPILKQKVCFLEKEKQELIEKLSNGQNIQNYLAINKRIQKLEKSGFITPPLSRRKNFHKDELESDDEEHNLKLISDHLDSVSYKNVKLENLKNFNDASTQVSLSSLKSIEKIDTHAEKSFIQDEKNKTKKVNRDNLKICFMKQVSIPPKPLPKCTTKSVGITTHFVLPLLRKNSSMVTELKWKDCADLKEIESKKLFLSSRGTDPVLKDFKDEIVQVVPKYVHRLIETDRFKKRDFGISFNNKIDLGLRPIHKTSQTDRVLNCNQILSTSKSCSKCEVKQTETIGVGSSANDMTDSQINATKPLTSFFNSKAKIFPEIKYNNTCNDKTCVKETNKEKTSSPTLMSKIPKLTSSSPHSVKLNVSNNIIIEEGNNDEILVYRNPNPETNLASRKQQSNYSSMMTPRIDLENIRLLDEACKITDSDSNISSSSSEGTFILETTFKFDPKKTPSKELKAALKVMNDSLQRPDRPNKAIIAKSLKIIEKEWFLVAASQKSNPASVEAYLDCFEKYSKNLLNKVVNLMDENGNTAMHYAISHSNFDVVSVLLDSKVCDVNKQNKVGYTPIMLVSLASVLNEIQKAVIKKLFSLGNVNIRAKQNGQTALMLASSHGKHTTCKLLLEAGTDINVQDNDGSTALMCAVEHGHVHVVKLLLSHPDCDINKVDNDKSTAMSIALESGRKDIALLLYASSNTTTRNLTSHASLRRSQSKDAASNLKKTGSFSSRSSQSCKSWHSAFSPIPSPTRTRHASSPSVKSSKSPKMSIKH